MKRFLGLGLAVFAGALLLVPAAGAGPGSGRGQTIHVIEHALTDAVTDTGKKGDSAGDLLTFANPVYSATNTTKVGSDQGFCIRTVVGKAWECYWTLFLSGGQLTVEGPFYDAGPSKLAVTGGTGSYAGARGWMFLRARNAKGTAYDFVYHLV